MTWDATGNHTLALPSIAVADAAVHAANVLVRRRGALLTWAAAGQPDAGGQALVRVGILVDGAPVTLRPERWERLDRWVPQLHASTDAGLGVVITICTPGGYDPIVPGGVIRVEVENHGAPGRAVTVAFEGSWAWSLATIGTTRPTASVHRLVCAGPAGCALEVGDGPDGAALALNAGADARLSVGQDADPLRPAQNGQEIEARNGTPLRYAIAKELQLGRRATVSLYMGVGAERDGALSVCSWLAQLGAAELIRLGRLELARIGRGVDTPFRDIAGRNVAFHHYCSVARAIDDDRLYPVLRRAPAHGACAVFSERAALAWSLPAHALADPLLAREIYVRILEQYSDRPGRCRRYVDGGALVPGFALGSLCDYVLALELVIDALRDEALLDDPLVRQVLREIDDMVFHRLHPEIFLAATEMLPSGDRADYPYVAFDNVLLWRLCRALGRFAARTSDGADRYRMAGGDEEAEAAFWQRCTAEVDGLHVIAGSTDMIDGFAIYDDPAGSLALLPALGFCSADDPIWTNTMDLLRSKRYPLWHGEAPVPGLAARSRPEEASMAALCADLLGDRRDAALTTLRALHLPGGVACETWDPQTGEAASGAWAAAEAGFLVWALLRDNAPDAPVKRAP